MLGEFTEQRMVEVGRVNFGQGIDIALFPVLDQIDVELTRPADPTFEKGELELREAARHPTQEQGLTHRLVGGREMTDVVIGEIARRHAHGKPTTAGMKGRSDFELNTFGPDRVVVVVTVKTQDVPIRDEFCRIGVNLSRSRNIAPDQTAQHNDLQTELRDRVFQLRNSLIRGVHGNHSRGCQPVCVFAKILGAKGIEGAAGRLTLLCIGNQRQAEAGRRIHHAEVEAEFVQPFIQKLRHDGGGPVACILGRQRPKRLLPGPVSPALGHGHGQFLLHQLGEKRESFDGFIATDFSHFLSDQRAKFQPVSIRVDNGMVQLGAYL